MADEIIKELWKIKDDICNEYGYNVNKLVAHLKAKKHIKDHVIVDLRAMKKTGEPSASPDGGKPRAKDGINAHR